MKDPPLVRVGNWMQTKRLFVLDSTGCIWTLDPVNQAGVGVDGGWTAW